MTPKIKSTSKSLPTISSSSKKARDIDHAMVTEAIGAEDAQEIESGLGGSPWALCGLRQALRKQLHSTGGRRSLKGVSRRQKIPLSEDDWRRLQEVAEATQSEDVRPTPAQVASVLLHQALQELK
jgi:hypothetical protein